MRFKTVFEFEEVDSVPGEQFKKERQLIIDEQGHEVLETVGETDLQAFIDSHEASVNLDIMLERYARGDDSVLDKVKGFYADISSLPVDLMEVMNMNIRGRELFDGLDPEIKSIFGNNYMTFLAEPQRFNQYMADKNAVESSDDAPANEVPDAE